MDSAFLPLYLNSGLVNNLYTVGLDLFSNIKIDTLTNKTQEIIKYTTPASELVRNPSGAFIQGDLQVQLLNEATLQRTTIDITALIRLKDLFKQADMLSAIQNPKDISQLKENDYVEVTCDLNRCRPIDYAEDLLDELEVSMLLKSFKGISKDELDVRCRIVDRIRERIRDEGNRKTQRLISEPMLNTNVRAVIPIQDEHLLDNKEHLLTGRVTVLGKVLTRCMSFELDWRLKGGTMFDKVDEAIFAELAKEYNLNTKIKCKHEISEKNIPVVVIMPIAIYS